MSTPHDPHRRAAAVSDSAGPEDGARDTGLENTTGRPVSIEAGRTNPWQADPAADDDATGGYISSGGATAQAEAGRGSIPGYDVLGVLGRGGMGVVYKARQIKADRIVALKLMLHADHADDVERERFDTEARAVARLQHPNIVQVFEVAEADGRPYFSLEYVNGGTLSRAIRQTLPPPADAARLMATLASAVAHAHRHGVIHRDLKPANILLAFGDPAGGGLAAATPKVADFGLARRVDGSDAKTRAGTILGTPSYMAPEQAAGDPAAVGPAADIYALGAILYELLTGRPPFKGADLWAVIAQVRSEEPVAPSVLSPKVPRDLETICLKCLSKEPKRRYGTADELADDLRRYLDSRPILARPVGPLERAVRWCRRNPAPAALIAVSLLAAVAATAAALVIRHERNVAEKRLVVHRGLVFQFVNEAPELVGNNPLAGGVKADLLELELRLLTEVQGQAEVGAANDRGRLAIAVRRGELAQQEGKYDEADAHFREALAAVEQIERTDAEKDRSKGNRALVLMQLGGLEQTRATELARRGDPAAAARRSAAAAHLRAAVGLREQVARQPESGEVDPAQARRDLGWAHVVLAAALTAQKDRPAALASAREGQTLLERALGELPDDPRKARVVRNYAGRAAVELARALGPDGPEAEVRAAYQRAVDLFRQLTADSPRDTGARVNLSVAASEFGDALLIRWNRPQEAVEMFALAQVENRALTTAPELVNLQQVGVALGYYRLGVAAQRAGRAADAQKHFERCLELRELRVHQLEDDGTLPKNAPPTVNAKIDRMLAQARVAGKAADAAKTAEGVLKLCDVLTVPADATQAAAVVGQRAYWRILAACGLALASDAVPQDDPRRADYRAKALNAVRLAIADGYANRAFLETDPDLDPIRDDPRFRRVISPVTGAAN